MANQDRTADPSAGSLIRAAERLAGLGRLAARDALLAAALTRPDSEAAFRAATEQALADKAPGFAEACLLACADAGWAWRDAVLPGLYSRLAVTPARIRQRLAAIRPEQRLDLGSRHGHGLCYVLNSSLPHDTSGYAIRTQELARALSATPGSALTCLTRPGYPWDRGVPEAADRDEVAGRLYQRIVDPDRRRLQKMAYIDAAVPALVTRIGQIAPAAVMAASNCLNALPALLAARRLGLPFVYDVRGFWELTRRSNNPAFGDSADYANLAALEGLVAAEADLVFTLNGAMRDELARRGADPARIVLLPNAADPDRFRPQPRDTALAARHGLPPGVPVIGYVGSLTPYEGLDDLVAACDQLALRGRDFRLVIVGGQTRHRPGQPDILEALRADVAARGLADRAILPGPVPHDEVAGWYSLIDIVALPRKATPVTELVSPMKSLEAMAMEKALVVSDLPPLREVIDPDRTGLVYPRDDVAGLAGALDRLLSDPEARARLGAAARAAVVTRHSWAAVARTCAEAIGTLTDSDIDTGGRGQGPDPALQTDTSVALEARLADIAALADSHDRDIAALRQELAEAHQARDALLGSTSWKLTAPLRRLRAALGGHQKDAQ